jgi:hypothetical protein
MAGRARIDLANQRFGDWLVLSHIANTPNWFCRCRGCGTERPVHGGNLRSGGSKGCGCKKAERISAGNTNHGHAAGGTTSLTYHSWRNMLMRCYTPTHSAYVTYGGAGVIVHQPWRDSFARFVADVGERPSRKHTLDRYPDKIGNYVPGNVRWATRSQQNNNRNNNHVLEIGGRSLTIAEWSADTGVAWHTIAQRLKRGWSPKRAISPVTRPSPRRCGEEDRETAG